MRLIIALILICLESALSAQTNGWKEVMRINSQAEYCELDPLNNLYIVKLGQVQKLDPQGKELNRFSNKLIGEDIQLDVTNPMKVLIYSADQMTLFTLDSRLGEMTDRINFIENGFEQVTLTCTSYDNSLWVYDPINFVIIRLNDKLEEQSRSLRISQLLRLELYPTDLIELNNKVYLTDPEHGVFVFDAFGNYLRKVPIKGIHRLVISHNRLFYLVEDELRALNLLDSSEELVTIGEVDGEFDVNRNRVAVIKEDEIIIYQALH